MKYEITLNYNEQTKNGKELIKKIHIEELEKEIKKLKNEIQELKNENELDTLDYELDYEILKDYTYELEENIDELKKENERLNSLVNFIGILASSIIILLFIITIWNTTK